MGATLAGTTMNNVDNIHRVATHNTGTDQGANYGICASYNFYSDASYAM